MVKQHARISHSVGTFKGPMAQFAINATVVQPLWVSWCPDTRKILVYLVTCNFEVSHL